MVLSYKLTSVVLIFHLYFVVTKWPIHDSFIMEQRCQSLDHKIVSFVDKKYNITFTVKNEFHVLQQLLYLRKLTVPTTCALDNMIDN